MALTYPQAVQFLNGLSRFGWRLGLERMVSLCEALGHPERSFDSIHVAGTNGKGSTCTYLAGMLQAHGCKTGLYTSPHLYDGRERIRVNGEMIPEQDVCTLVEALADPIRQAQQQHGPVTEFEAWTMVMLLHFQRMGVKTAVIEAGLGGRWDSTNVINPLLALLTNVSLDHTDRLGNTIAEIARDKAGIIKPGGRLLVGPLNREARAEVEDEARTAGATVYSLHQEGMDSGATDPEHAFTWESAGHGAFLLARGTGAAERVHYQGAAYQARNAALAAAAAALLADNGYPIDLNEVQAGLKVQVPGRFEVIRQEPQVILDGAHNTAAAAVLAAELIHSTTALKGERPSLRLVFGSASGHDAEGCLRILAPLANELILTRARNPRARDPQELSRSIHTPSTRVEVIPDVAAAVQAAIHRSKPYDRVCVTGSFFVLGEVPRPA